MLSHFSLFTGIGGIDLAAEWAGFETVGMCEIDEYCRKVLDRHWPDVPKWRDIRGVTAESVRESGIKSVDLVSGGFPCQPHSVIGKRCAEKDERHLWPEMVRVIRELRPTWVVGENVNGILSTIHADVCSDIEEEGYKVRTFCVPAIAVGAHHQRYRVFVVCFSEGQSGLQAHPKPLSFGSKRQAWENPCRINRGSTPGVDWSVYKPGVFGMAYGLSSKMDRATHNQRHKALGNAVVPQQVYPILKAIAEIEGVSE